MNAISDLLAEVVRSGQLPSDQTRFRGYCLS